VDTVSRQERHSMQFWKALFLGDSIIDPVQPLESLKLEDWLDESFLSPTVHRLNQEAIVEDIYHQGHEWCIKYLGSLWRARAMGNPLHLAPGDIVYVVARRGNVLFIEGR
jgi:hypothetical protein